MTETHAVLTPAGPQEETMTTSETPVDTSEYQTAEPTLYRATASAAHRLQRAVLDADPRSRSTARATMSLLRRAVAREPGEDPLVWNAVAQDILGDLPEEDIGRGDAPSPAEWAAFVAVTLFAAHQQSQRAPMHAAGISLGAAVARLRRITESGSIKPRLDAVMVASTPQALRYHLRSLISLLGAHGIPLDYGLLAEDLRWLRHPRRRRGVVLRWGRDYATGLARLRKSTAPSD